MGNLGSVHNVAAAANFDVTADNEYQRNYQHSKFAHDQHQELENASNSLHWLPPSSYPSTNSGPQSQSHIKVLPKIPKSSRLRVTNNGTILQSGGTISSRRNQLLTSSQSSKHINHHHHDVLSRASTAKNPEAPQYLQRRFSSGTAVVFAQTNDNVDTPESFNRSSYGFMEPTSYNHDVIDNVSNRIPIVSKHYGSEPDLRSSLDNETNTRNAWKSPSPSKTKLAKKKKKNPAPTPPPAVNHHSGKDQENLHMIPGGGQSNRIELRKAGGGDGLLNEPQRKHRLFKTKAESRKCDWKPINAVKPAFGASDFRQLPSPDRPSRNLPSSSRPPPVFRREKSFDIILLRNNKLKEQIATDSNPIISKTPPLQRKRSVVENYYQQDARHKTNAGFLIMADTKPNHNRSRKYSQPETALLAKRNFKKELEEATIRRSMVISTTRNDIIQRNESKNQNSSTNKENFSLVPPKKTVETAINKIEQHKSKDGNNFNATEIAIKLPTASRIPQLQMTKTFYFGMDANKSATEQTNEVTQKVLGKVQMDVIDQFAKSIFAAQEYGEYQESLGSSESALSSEEGDTSYYQIGKTIENHIKKIDAGSLCDDEDVDKNGSHQIQVLVRPTLPRRQLEIPRFSPAAAWRMLNDDSQQQVLLTPTNNGITSQTDNNEQPPLPLEERIQMVYRGPPVPMYADNKSGDSGISGDAGLPDCTDGPRNPGLGEVKIEPFLTQWTPQQDLDDDDDDDYNDDDGGGGGGDDDCKEDRASSEDGCDKRINKYPSRGHLFSLSLPRETHLSLYEDKNKPGFSSLQKLKRTVSGVFSNQVSRDTTAINYRSDNWLLSRSAPNSIDSSQVSPAPGCRGTNKLNNTSVIPSASFGYLKAGNHVMYLPNTPAEEAIDCSKSPSGHIPIQAKYSDKIIENFKAQNESDKNNEKLENLEDPVNSNSSKKIEDKVETVSPVKKFRTGHRFTFQSTVRQIERRRIADKLSKEAERNEAQRLSELEVMRKVEEEFQRKRAREKASIRHQLRLFSLEENQCVSLPVDIPLNANGDFENVNAPTQYQRADPDGATSSPESSPILLNYSKTHLKNKIPDASNAFLKSGLEFVEKLSQAQHLPLQNCESLLNHHRIPRREYFEYRSSDNYDKKKYKSLQEQLRQPEGISKIPHVD